MSDIRAAMRMAAFVMYSLAVCAGMLAQTGPLRISKIEPPNWWVGLPKPMLLLSGEGLAGARFSLSDPSLHIENTVISDNGHWAQLWLASAPAKPETISVHAKRGAASVTAQYTFSQRTAAPQGFSAQDVMYLALPDRFADGDLSNDGLHATSASSSDDAAAESSKPRGWHGGDLRGMEQHLDYLQQLGVTALWMTPIDENLGAESYHGYHATDMYAVDPHFGTLDDLKSLGAELHRRGMKLVLDTVPNHVGPLHPWVTDEPAPDWFHGTAAHHLDGETNFRALIDPHAPERDRVGTLQGWFANQLPDMNTKSPAVAKYLRQNAEWWIEETGADALRIDTFPYIDRPFWHDYDGELKQLYPRLTEVGEIVNPDPVIVSSFADGVTRAGVDTKLYTPFDFPSFFALRDVLRKGAPMTKLANTIADDALYPHPERLVVLFDNHDNARFLSGGGSAAAMRLAYAFVMTTRGTPQLYYGDEILMAGGEDPDNRKDFPGGFNSRSPNAFVESGRTPEQQAMFAWVSTLAKIRKDYPALACGAEQILKSNDDWLVYVRDPAHAAAGACTLSESDRNVPVVIAIHRGEKPSDLSFNTQGTWIQSCTLAPDLLSHNVPGKPSPGGEQALSLQGNEVLISPCRADPSQNPGVR